VPHPAGKDRLVFDTASPELGVRVTAKGTRIFIAQWTDPATKRKVREPLGVWGTAATDGCRHLLCEYGLLGAIRRWLLSIGVEF
jgi:hypothetical protein